ncbi:DUF3626 domain-containing protein [Alicyclobacillus curvatus]|nr:DUF3626 domain-containing protein [Alicyclobacillus curvatus]
MGLTAVQSKAIGHVEQRALQLQSVARRSLGELFSEAGCTTDDISTLISSIQTNGRVTLNFHPDRMLPVGHSVVWGMLRDGLYKNQFETQVTNGSRTAFPGGERDLWEHVLFGGAYHEQSARASHRPKYGGFNIMNYADGASPRFGSCFLQLYPHVSSRCTFTFGDSHTQPECVGTLQVFEPILAELVRNVKTSGVALGSVGHSVGTILERLSNVESGFSHAVKGALGRALDDYIEAQVHGDIDLSADVEMLVADPSFQGTPVGEALEHICFQYGIKLAWHPGFNLCVDDVPEDFRGAAMPPFAHLVERFATVHGRLDAATLGRAAASFYAQPECWRDWAEPDVTFQHFKQLWHVLVRFGEPSPI